MRKQTNLLTMLLLAAVLTGCAGTLKVDVVDTPGPDEPEDQAAAVDAAVEATLGARSPSAGTASTPEGAVVTPSSAPTSMPFDTRRGTPLAPSAWPAPVAELANEAGRWQVFTSTNQVQDLALGGDYLWAATEGGLVRWDIEEAAYVKYTTLRHPCCQ